MNLDWIGLDRLAQKYIGLANSTHLAHTHT